jgi:UDP:flavonoid glycosyltransferase YjiC (YdhE family)
MRALILTLGTRGDLELFLILGRALAARGHEVTVAGSLFNAAAVERAGLQFAAAGNAGTREQLVAALRSAGRSPDLVERTRAFYEAWLRPQLGQAIQAIAPLTKQTDVFINNLKLLLRRGEHVLPAVSVTYDPPLQLDDLSRFGPQRAEVLDLVAMPQALIDPERRWDARYRFTGFWTPPDRADVDSLPPRVQEFLANGPAPIVFTLGSMAFADPQSISKCIVNALELSGRRGILVRGWALGEIDEHASPNVLVVDEAPYEPLFAHAAAVAHHGGVGTLAAVLRAGKPSIILPQIACQRVFGEILRHERLAAGAIVPSSLTPEALANCIAATTTDAALAVSALKWRERLLAEDGAARAAEWIETHAEGLRRDR